MQQQQCVDFSSLVSERLRGLDKSATLEINEASADRQRQGLQTFRLGLGQSPFPVPDRVVAALRANADQKDYLAVEGLAELREAVAAFHERVDGITRSPQRVLIGPGSKELMFILQLACDAELLLPNPSWVSYAPQAQLVQRPVQWLDTDQHNGWRLDPQTLAAHCQRGGERARLLVLNSPSNPTGMSYDADQLQALADVARAHNVLVLSDEIYGPTHHRNAHTSIARFYPQGTIVSGGLSKWCGAGGWRLGTFSLPDELDELASVMASIASETYTSVAAPIQRAAIEAFTGGDDIEEYLDNSRAILTHLATAVVARLQKAGVSVDQPDGGFYIFPSFEPMRDKLASRGITSGQTLCQRLLEETGVAMLPGSSFGRPDTELTARIAYVDFSGDEALKAWQARDADATDSDALIERLAPNVLEAIDRICQWTA